MVVLDRSGIDALIDVMSSCGWREVREVPLGRFYQSLHRRHSTNVFLRVGRESAVARKPESALDPKLDVRLALYERLAKEYADITVLTEDRDDSVHQQIWESLFGKSRDPAAQLGLDGHMQGKNWWYEWVKSRRLPKVLQLAILLGTHWLFQSILYMDRTERLFKAAVGLIGFVTAFFLTSALLPLWSALLVSFVISHSANLLVNAHLPVVLKHFSRPIPFAKLERFLPRIIDEIKSKPWVSLAVVIGSLARREDAQPGDVDIRIVRKVGFENALKACFFALRMRTRSLVEWFPLDLYVFDSESRLHRSTNEDEIAAIRARPELVIAGVVRDNKRP